MDFRDKFNKYNEKLRQLGGLSEQVLAQMLFIAMKDLSIPLMNACMKREAHVFLRMADGKTVLFNYLMHMTIPGIVNHSNQCDGNNQPIDNSGITNCQMNVIAHSLSPFVFPGNKHLINMNQPSVLFLAIMLKSPELVKYLIPYGADVNARNQNNMTSLMLAADNNLLDICQVLINSGADKRLVDDQGRTAFQIATAKGYTNLLPLLL